MIPQFLKAITPGIFCILSLCSVNASVTPLNDYIIKNLTTDDGLPMNQLNSLAVNREGFLWIATFEGLIRYDGHTFNLISHRDYETLKGGAFEIEVDEDGRIWAFDTNHLYLFRYDNGMFASWDTSDYTQVLDYTIFKAWDGHMLFLGRDGFYEIKDERITPYPIKGIDGLKIHQALFSANKTLWVAEHESGLYSIKNGQRIKIDLSGLHLNSDRIVCIEEGIDGSVWAVSSENDLIHVKDLKAKTYSDTKFQRAGRIRDMLSEKDGTVWIGSEAGMFRFNQGVIEKLEETNDPVEDHIFSIERTPEGSIAYTTFNEGLKLLEVGAFQAYSQRNGLRGGVVRTIVPIEQGGHLIGTTKGVSLIQNGIVTHVYEELDGIDVTDIKPMPNGEIYFATYGQGLYRYHNGVFTRYIQKDGLPSDTVYRIEIGPDNLLWIASYSGIAVFDGEQFINLEVNSGLTSLLTISLFRDHLDRMWLSMASAGLCYVKDGQVTQVTQNTDLENSTVFHLSQDQNGVIWGGYSGGVLKIENDTFTAYNLTGIFPRTNIFHAWNDNKGSLWLTSNSGVYEVDIDHFNGSDLPKELPYQSYLKTDGLPENNVTALSHAYLTNDQFWIPFNGGVAIIESESKDFNPYLPDVFIENIEVNNQTILQYPTVLAPKKVLNSDFRQIRISYTAPSYQANNRILFKSRLKGFDDWEVTSRREAVYTSLPPGDYVFEVSASYGANSEKQTDIASFAFSIEPKFYQTITFYFFSVVSLVLIGHLLNYVRLRAAKVQQIKLSNIVDQRTLELRRNSAELRIAKDQAESANRMKSEFIANISHEIRTPMNSILGFTDILENELEDPKHLRYLNSVHTSGRTLLSLINDLLDLSKLEANKLKISKSPTDIVELYEQIILSFEPLVSNKPIRIGFQTDKGFPAYLMIDEARLRQVLVNLLSNAVKFTSSGEITLTLECIEKNNQSIHIRSQIIDTGEGIESDKIESIFEAFEQVSNKHKRSQMGSGLGLSISKELIELMGGTISVSSEVGVGSTFTIDFYSLEIHNTPKDKTNSRADISRISPKVHKRNYSQPDLPSADEIYEFLNTPTLSLEESREFQVLCRDILIPGLTYLDIQRLKKFCSAIGPLKSRYNHLVLTKLIDYIAYCIDSLSVEDCRKLRNIMTEISERYE